MNFKHFYFFIFLFLIGSASAGLNIGYDFDNENRVVLDIPTTPINYSLIPTVNNSNYWDGLDTPADIDHNLLNNLEWSVAGHTIDTFINMAENSLVFANLVSANSMQIWDDTLNEDAILSMYTHDLSNSFILQVTDAGATDFYSGEQYQFRSGDNLFQIIHDMYTGTYLNIDVGNTNPEITSKDGIISFVGDNLTTTGTGEFDNLIVKDNVIYTDSTNKAVWVGKASSGVGDTSIARLNIGMTNDINHAGWANTLNLVGGQAFHKRVDNEYTYLMSVWDYNNNLISSIINDNSQNVRIVNNVADKLIYFELKSSGGATETILRLRNRNYGTSSSVFFKSIKFDGGAYWTDNKKANFGTAPDMSIYYGSDGHGYINPKEVGSGELRVLGEVNATIITSQNGYSGYCVNTTYLNGIAINCND